MREEFTVARKFINPVTNETQWVPVKVGLSFLNHRWAEKYKDEFYSGPNYLVISRHVTDWTVVA